jgi:hypothetical protein
MSPNEYTNALEKAIGDLENKVLKRDLLNGDIAGLKETVRVLSSRVELSTKEQERVARLIAMVDSATPKLTDAIRSLLLSEYPKAMTAIEVRNALEDGSDSEGVSLSACHAALKRILKDGEVVAGNPKEGKATYRWIGRPILTANHANAYSVMRSLSDLAAPTIEADSVPNSLRGAIEAPRQESWRSPRKTLGQRIAERQAVEEMGKADSDVGEPLTVENADERSMRRKK